MKICGHDDAGQPRAGEAQRDIHRQRVSGPREEYRGGRQHQECDPRDCGDAIQHDRIDRDLRADLAPVGQPGPQHIAPTAPQRYALKNADM